MKPLRQLLRCDTQEQCRRIQRGWLPLRRLGKWSVLFTVALMLLLNDTIAVCIDRLILQYEEARGLYEQAHGQLVQAHERYTEVTGSVLYRWTIGWFHPPVEAPSIAALPAKAPELDERSLFLYRLLNSIQLAFFLACCAYCLPWVYADFRADGHSGRFSRFCIVAVVSNLALYFLLHSWGVGLAQQVA